MMHINSETYQTVTIATNEEIFLYYKKHKCLKENTSQLL